jgi:hypothetical protein
VYSTTVTFMLFYFELIDLDYCIIGRRDITPSWVKRREQKDSEEKKCGEIDLTNLQGNKHIVC